jgi:uncharacterized cupin superfamily protein
MKPLHALDVPAQSDSPYPQRFAAQIGVFACRPLTEQFGLTQFGINFETLQPGAQSALRHWHSHADEFVYVLEGELVLRTDDGEDQLEAGMCVGFKGGVKNAHHLVNQSDRIARYLVVGARIRGDLAYCPDDDFMWCRNAEGMYPAHKNGVPYWLPGQEAPR